MEKSACGSSAVFHRRGLHYVEVLLQGGAPWGFTLKGGLEHGEPLIISKVEDGGKAGLLEHPLEPGDQVVNINEVELSGSRQEAISLVKGSYKTLRLTITRECSLNPCCPEPASPPPVGPTQSQGHSQDSRGFSGGVRLRIRNRRSEPGSRPHSWHSTKLGEGQQDPSMMQISQSGIGAPWHRTCQSSASTTDLSSYDPGYLRKSPDQYSSRGSMESLDHGHPAYSSCHQLSSSKSSNSIDHLHNKRDSAYSSFSTSSSIPEYPTAAPSFSKERSYSMESMLSHRGPEGMRQADIRYVRTVYDPQQGISQEHEVSSAKVMRNLDARTQVEIQEGGLSELTTRGSSASVNSCNSMTNHISVGTTWGLANSRNSYENLKGAPAPPLRSDSYAAIKNHERPNSWSSLEQARSLRALQKGSWTHSSGSVSSAKSSFIAEGQLHTVMEKSPESSPTTRPKQNFPQAPQPGRFMLPTGIYPVPQPEPHFAQIPTTCPSSGTMYPALAKESMCPSHRDQDREGNNIDTSIVENRNQSKTPSTTSQIPGFPKPKPSVHYEGKRQEESDTKCGHYKPHFKPSTEVCGISQVQNQEPSYRHIAQNVIQERRDPYTRVQQRVDRQKHSQGFENSEVQRQTREEEPIRPPAWTYHLQNTAVSTEARDTFNRTQIPYGIYRDVSFPTSQGSREECVHIQKNDSVNKVLPRHYSDTDALQQQQSDHPLTRLENALMQVQRSNSEDPSRMSIAQTESNECDTMHLSVLEKVSRFEQREQRRSQSQSDMRPSYASQGSIRPCQAPSTKASYSSMEDSRNKEGLSSISNTKAWSHNRTQSCSMEGKESMAFENSKECQQYPTTFQLCGSRQPSLKNPHGKFMPIQRSKSSYQLSGENGKNFHMKEDTEDNLGTVQDSSFNRTYRDSIKDAQTKVLRSTSFRRKDLTANPSVASKHLSLERKAPKTSPKPAMTSPHTPKERHIVTPEAEKSIPPPLPSIPAVGPPVTRIGGRKRLTLEQKKRSYSEPEKMHELGLSDSEDSQKKAPQQFFFPETSVADKRKLFEMAANKSRGLSLSSSRPELKQLQQDALADYMERKTGRRAAGYIRPTSAYLQPSSSDSQSISSASSFASLQESNLLWTSQSDYPEMNRLPPSLKGSCYPNENPAQFYSLSKNASHHKQQGTPQELFGSEKEPCKSSLAASSEHLQSKFPWQNQNRSFERTASPRSSGKSASAEDLLEHSEELKLIPQHFRSRSSPSEEKLIKAAVADHSVFGMFSKEPLLSGSSNSRFARNSEQDRPAGTTHRMEKCVPNPGPSHLNPPVIRKEKQRLTERQRSHSTMGLAASVGLPCSFSPPPSNTQLDWQASERLCQANMDVLTCKVLPFTAQAQAAPGGVTSQSSAETSTREETAKEVQWECCTSQVPITTTAMSVPQGKGEEDDHSAPCGALNGPAGASHEPLCQTEGCSTPLQHLPSLCIFESDLQLLPPALTKDDDDVFLEDPGSRTPPPPPCVPVQETDITGFPPLPPLTAPMEHEPGANTPSQTALDNSAAKQLQSLSASPVTSDLPSTPITKSLSVEDEAQSLVGSTEEVQRGAHSDDQKGVEEDIVLCRRQRSVEELRVEALSRDLVSRDKSLTPILGTWAVKSTVDLMEDIFPTGVLLPQQQRNSSQMEDRSQEQNSTAGNMQPRSQNKGMETDLDEEESNLNLKKREALAEEQKKFSELGNHIEALVQEHCKPNECDKYRMFVGDLDKIVNLLLSLCGRLARVENALAALDGQDSEDSSKERESLQRKRNQLCGQHEDARELKENLDRRERVVLDILAGYLSAQQLCDYKHLVRMKPALLIRQRCLDDLIRQGEEQLQRLGEMFQPAGWEQPGGPAPTAASVSPRSTTVTSL
ncbi:protein Shroom3 isoform X1 [Arapaima gigas]